MCGARVFGSIVMYTYAHTQAAGGSRTISVCGDIRVLRKKEKKLIHTEGHRKRRMIDTRTLYPYKLRTTNIIIEYCARSVVYLFVYIVIHSVVYKTPEYTANPV